MRRAILLFLLVSATLSFAHRAEADVYYYGGPAYYRPVYARRAYAYNGPTGAALGPWPWNFDFGGGPTSIAGTSSVLNPGWNFQMGAGVNFTPRAGLIFEYLDNGLAVDGKYLQNNQATDGYAHVWGLTIDPIWRYTIGGPLGGYIVGGGGFYERQLRLTQPATVFVPTFGGGFYAPGYEVNRQIDDAGGLNIGAGLTCHLGYGTKLFVEARYHYIFTSGGVTRLIPITIGVRW